MMVFKTMPSFGHVGILFDELNSEWYRVRFPLVFNVKLQYWCRLKIPKLNLFSKKINLYVCFRFKYTEKWLVSVFLVGQEKHFTNNNEKLKINSFL